MPKVALEPNADAKGGESPLLKNPKGDTKGHGIRKSKSTTSRTLSLAGTICVEGETRDELSEIKHFRDAAGFIKKAIGLKNSIRKVAGDIKLLHVEEATDHEPGEFLLHPMSDFRRGWDIVTSILILWMCFYVPFKIGELDLNLEGGMVERGFFRD